VQLKEKYENMLKNDDKDIDFPKPSEPYYTIAENKKRKKEDMLKTYAERSWSAWSADEITE
jgi:hypothetical protein